HEGNHPSGRVRHIFVTPVRRRHQGEPGGLRVADSLDHTHPGWRTTPVFAPPFWNDAVTPQRRLRDIEAWTRAAQRVLPDGWIDSGGPVRVHGAEPEALPPTGGTGRYQVVTGEAVQVAIIREKAGRGALTFPPTPGRTRPGNEEEARAILASIADRTDNQQRHDMLRLAHQAKALDPVVDGLFGAYQAEGGWNLIPSGGALTPLPPTLRRFESKGEALQFANRAAILLHTPPLAGANPPLDFADPQFEEALARHLADIGAHPSTLTHLLLATRAGLDRDHQRHGSRFVREWTTYEDNPTRAAAPDGHAWADELRPGDWIAITIAGHPTRRTALVVDTSTDALGGVCLELDLDGTATDHTVARNTPIVRTAVPRQAGPEQAEQPAAQALPDLPGPATEPDASATATVEPSIPTGPDLPATTDADEPPAADTSVGDTQPAPTAPPKTEGAPGTSPELEPDTIEGATPPQTSPARTPETEPATDSSPNDGATASQVLDSPLDTPEPLSNQEPETEAPAATENSAATVQAALLAKLEEFQDIWDIDPTMVRHLREAAPGPVIDGQTLFIAVTGTPQVPTATAALGHPPGPEAATWTADRLRSTDPMDLLAALSTTPEAEPSSRTTSPSTPPTPAVPAPPGPPSMDRHHQVLEAAQAALVAALRPSVRAEPARRYLAERGVPADGVISTHWGIGFAPGSAHLTDTLRAQGFTDAELLATGVSAEKDGRLFDALRNRITFPILDMNGRVIAFTGRALRESESARKWMNTRNTTLYTKGKALLGPGHHRHAFAGRGPFVIAEGAFDLVAIGEALHRDNDHAPIPASPCGTALTEQQVRALAAVDSQRDIVLVFDPDEAGDKALRAAWELLKGWRGRVYAIRLPAGDPAVPKNDPGRIFQTQGADALRALMSNNLQPALDAVLDAEVAGLLNHPTNSWQASERAVELILGTRDPQQIPYQFPRLAVLGLDLETLAQDLERELSHFADEALRDDLMRELRATQAATTADSAGIQQRPTMTTPEATSASRPERQTTPHQDGPHTESDAEPTTAAATQPRVPAQVGSDAWLEYWAEHLPPALPTSVAPLESRQFLNLVRDLAFRLAPGPDHVPGLEEQVLEATAMFARSEGDQAVRHLVAAAGDHPRYEEVGRLRQVLRQADSQQPAQQLERPDPTPKEEPSMTTPMIPGRGGRPGETNGHLMGSPDGPTFAAARELNVHELNRTDLTADQRLALQERWILNAQAEDNEYRAVYGEPLDGVFPGTQRRVLIDRDFTAPDPAQLVAGAPAGQDPVRARLVLVRHLTTRAAQETNARPDVAAAFRDTAQQLRLEVTGRPSDRPNAPQYPTTPDGLLDTATRLIRNHAGSASPLVLTDQLGLHYTAAEKLLDLLERAGIVGPLVPGAGLRTVAHVQKPDTQATGPAPQPPPRAPATGTQAKPTAGHTAEPSGPTSHATPIDQLTDAAATAIAESAGETPPTWVWPATEGKTTSSSWTKR
ncbi:DUF6349 family protein, partial [Kitasatospora sp. NPDC001574]